MSTYTAADHDELLNLAQKAAALAPSAEAARRRAERLRDSPAPTAARLAAHAEAERLSEHHHATLTEAVKMAAEMIERTDPTEVPRLLCHLKGRLTAQLHAAAHHVTRA